MDILKGTPEAIMHNRVDDFSIAHAVACASFGQQIGCITHTFHAAGHKGLFVACTDGLGGKHNSFQTRATDFVDGKGGNIHGKARVNGSLPSRCLANASRDDIAHDDFVNSIRRYA